MKTGDTILILPSFALSNLKLEALIGQSAKVVEVRGPFDNIKGCWVQLSSKYLGEQEWYIPYNSIGQ